MTRLIASVNLVCGITAFIFGLACSVLAFLDGLYILALVLAACAMSGLTTVATTIESLRGKQ